MLLKDVKMMTKNQAEELYIKLPLEVQYDIDMTLYDEFNNTYCTMNEYMGVIFDRRDLISLKRSETLRRKELIVEQYNKLYGRTIDEH